VSTQLADTRFGIEKNYQEYSRGGKAAKQQKNAVLEKKQEISRTSPHSVHMYKATGRIAIPLH